MADFSYNPQGQSMQFGVPLRNPWESLSNVGGGLVQGATAFNQLGQQLAQPQAQQDIISQFISGKPDYTKVAASLARMGDLTSGINMLKADTENRQQNVIKERTAKLKYFEDQANNTRASWSHALAAVGDLRLKSQTSNVDPKDIAQAQRMADELGLAAERARKEYFEAAKAAGLVSGEYVSLDLNQPADTNEDKISTVVAPVEPTSSAYQMGGNGDTWNNYKSGVETAIKSAKSYEEKLSVYDKAVGNVKSVGVKSGAGTTAKDATDIAINELFDIKPSASGKGITDEIIEGYMPDNALVMSILGAADPFSIIKNASENNKFDPSLKGLFNYIVGTDESKKKEAVDKFLSVLQGKYDAKIAEVPLEKGKNELKAKTTERMRKLKAKLSVSGGSTEETSKQRAARIAAGIK